ncbi:Uncharacterised protein [Legionella pneumophila]|nr:Uncharacterised protein [Legionella pneumophila]
MFLTFCRFISDRLAIFTDDITPKTCIPECKAFFSFQFVSGGKKFYITFFLPHFGGFSNRLTVFTDDITELTRCHQMRFFVIRVKTCYCFISGMEKLSLCRKNSFRCLSTYPALHGFEITFQIGFRWLFDPYQIDHMALINQYMRWS